MSNGGITQITKSEYETYILSLIRLVLYVPE